MANAKTGIQWTDATWSPVTGCSHVSPGCEHCYAEALSLRFGHSRHPWGAQYAAENVVLHPDRLDQPLKWRKPKKIFVNSMSDLFHERIPDEFIDRVFAVMHLAERHSFQVLTKRPERMLEYLITRPRAGLYDKGVMIRTEIPGDDMKYRVDWPLPNVWLGVSVELPRFKDRIDRLRECPAAVHFLSLEPLLGDLGVLDLSGIEWVITGGESGPHHRPMDPAWVRKIRDDCLSAGVAYFHKQNGGRTPKAGGDLLDGVQWHQFPEPAHA